MGGAVFGLIALSVQSCADFAPHVPAVGVLAVVALRLDRSPWSVYRQGPATTRGLTRPPVVRPVCPDGSLQSAGRTAMAGGAVIGRRNGMAKGRWRTETSTTAFFQIELVRSIRAVDLPRESRRSRRLDREPASDRGPSGAWDLPGDRGNARDGDLGT